MLVSFSWQGYLDFSLFILHFSLQQLTWYRLNYLTTDYLTTSETCVNTFMCATIALFFHIPITNIAFKLN